MTNTKKPSDKRPVTEDVEVVIVNEVPVIYADRIINFGMGLGVCRLTIGQELGPRQVKAMHQIVIPTEQFLEALDHMVNVIYKNEEFKANIINGIDNLKAKLQNFQE